VLAKLSMNDDVYHLVKNTPKVTGFLGPDGKPQAISEAEAARILSTKEEAAAAAPKAKVKVDYEIGDAVKVLDGPFASFNGVVEELDFRPRPREGQRQHLRPRHAGRAGSSSR
jgi:transcriptional antiterminator NusG